MLLCNDESGKWDSGAWSVAHETMTVADGATVYDMNGTSHDVTQGKVFAVIMHRDKTAAGTLESRCVGGRFPVAHWKSGTYRLMR